MCFGNGKGIWEGREPAFKYALDALRNPYFQRSTFERRDKPVGGRSDVPWDARCRGVTGHFIVLPRADSALTVWKKEYMWTRERDSSVPLSKEDPMTSLAAWYVVLDQVGSPR